jgi:DinB superfamily
MHIWEHLFLTGEFPARAHLLSGLTLEQVTERPAGASHSIYDELWHAATWQRIVVERDHAAGDTSLGGGEHYPNAAPEHEQQWDDVVRLFLDGARAAVAWAESPERLALEEEPGVTMADELHSLAVHNAYHLGKIVALRQRIGAWPPKAATEES